MGKKKINKKETAKEKKIKPKVDPELEGFDVRINRFGEITSTYDIDKINAFLNKKVDDKKLRDREDLDELKNSDEQEDLDEPTDLDEGDEEV